MRVYQTPDYTSMSRREANIISAHVILHPNCVLGLATGSTPLGAYAQLIEWYRKGDLSFAETRSVNLDEYRGLTPDHPQSYRCFMQTNFFDHIDIRPENTYLPDGTAAKGFEEVRLTPTTFLLDKQGRIVQKYLGAPDFPKLHALLEKLLAEPA